MCDYCEKVGIIRDPSPILLDDYIDYGVLGVGHASIYIDADHRGGARMILLVNNDGFDAHDIAPSASIQFCPICGRSLNN